MVLSRAAWLVAIAGALAGCHDASPLAPLAAFEGDWRCPMHHLTADPGSEHVVQDVAIAPESGGARYAVRFTPDRTEPSADAVTSVAYWSYDRDARQFKSVATVGDGQTAAEERYSSPGPQAGTLVWTGEVHAAIAAPIRMTFARHGGLEITVEAFADNAWKQISTASCTPRGERPG